MYNNLKKIYDENRLDVFAMSVAHLLDIGFKNARGITNEQIETIKEAKWATKEFLQELVRVARDIAVACDSNTELIMFCEANQVFDCTGYSGKRHPISWDRMCEIATNAIWGLHENGGDWEEELEYADLDLDDDEKEFFGIPVEEECDE